MNDALHPNHPDFVRHDQSTGEVEDEPVLDGEILDPIDSRVMATLHRVEIDQQVATAKAYPRNVLQIKQELKALVTMDEETAEECVYALPRGGKTINGPSARFADALISFWGNSRSGAFITQVNREEKFVEAIGSFQDVERNVIRQRRTRRPISDRKGNLYNADMINMTGNAACVIAERNAITNGIPKPFWGPIYDAAFLIVSGTTQTLGSKVARAKKGFLAMEIDFALVLEKIGRADESKIVPQDIIALRGMLTALKTGEETIESIFGRGAASTHEKAGNVLKDDEPAKSGTNAPKGQQKTEVPASKTGTSNPVGPQTSEKPTEQGSAGPGPDAGAAGNNAQPSTAAPSGAEKQAAVATVPDKPYEMTADGYMAFMRDEFDKAKARVSKSAVTEIWGSTREDRGELLSSDQLDELQKDKTATLAAIKLKEKP